jgi:hypothetical protein
MYNVELNGIDRVWKLLNWMPHSIYYIWLNCAKYYSVKIGLNWGENWTELIELGWKLDWIGWIGVKIGLKKYWILIGWKLDWKLLNLTEFNVISVL